MSDSDAHIQDELFDDMLGDFLDESGQLLSRLNEDMLRLDEWVRSLDPNHQQRCDEELLNDMFRSAHSLKGLSAMLGLSEINGLTHKIENVFDAARRDSLVIDTDVVDLMFQGIDRLVGLVDGLKDPDAEPAPGEAVVEGIAQLLQRAGVERKQSSQSDAEQTLADISQETETPSADAMPKTVEGESSPADSAPTTETVSPTSIDDPFEGLLDDTEISDKYLALFIDETEQSLNTLTEYLLALEGDGSSEVLKQLLVVAHRIKGSAASVGLNRPAKLAHFMEDQLQRLVDTSGLLSPEMTDAMLKCADELRAHTRELRETTPAPDRFSEVARELLSAASGEGARDAAVSPKAEADKVTADDTPTSPPPAMAPEAPVSASTSLPGELHRLVASKAPMGMDILVGEVRLQPNLPLAGLKAQVIHERLSQHGALCYFDPPFDGLEDVEGIERVAFGLVSTVRADEVADSLRLGGVASTRVEPMEIATPAANDSQASSSETPETKAAVSSDAPGQPPAKAPATPAPTDARKPKTDSPQEGAARPTETLRVDIERLDQLMNLSGQLVINKARLSRIGDGLKGLLESKQSLQALDRACHAIEKITAHQETEESSRDMSSCRQEARRLLTDLDMVRHDVQAMNDVRSSVNDLFETIHQLDRVTDSIQQSVMDTRMLPIGPLFARFKRVIRDITRSNGKNVRLVINGEKTELDKRMIDELSDPLIHIVRNSADHGIELPEVRQAAGKPAQGTVTLDAFHRGNSIVIQVTDDGKGLDADAIRRKALDKGLITEADAEKMTPHQFYQLIWEPGLTTAEKVTQVSGRGMGMDIVKSKIEELNGAVDLDSEPGKGTTLTIKLPLTLAILPSLMVDISEDIFAMPLESVIEIVRVSKENLATVHGQRTARVRERIVSLVSLDNVLTFHARQAKAAAPPSDDTTLVIVGDSGREIGLAVDRVLGEEDIVIKSMAENFRNVPGIAGASILGDGRVSLILDLIALIDMSCQKASLTRSASEIVT